MKNVILVMMALVGWVAGTASQAQPADSTGAGRAISAQGTISSSTATTGTYTPPPVVVADTPPPAPVYDANRAWTLSFVGETKCLSQWCLTIEPGGVVKSYRAGIYWCTYGAPGDSAEPVPFSSVTNSHRNNGGSEIIDSYTYWFAKRSGGTWILFTQQVGPGGGSPYGPYSGGSTCSQAYWDDFYSGIW
jgi:hypothetical protein